MNLTEEERKFLIHHLKGELVWTSGMKSQYDSIYDKRYNHLVSILSKLGEHPLKSLLEKKAQ